MYVIAANLATNTDAPIAGLGTPANDNAGAPGSMVIRTRNAGQAGVRMRTGNMTGSVVFRDAKSSAPAGALMITSGWWTGEQTYVAINAGAPIESSPGLLGGEMIASPMLRLAPIGKGVTPAMALAYRGAHDLATRTRVMAWLAQRFSLSLVARLCRPEPRRRGSPL